MARRKRAKKVEYSFDYKGQGWPLVLLRSTEVVAAADMDVKIVYSSPIRPGDPRVIVCGAETMLKIEPHESNPLPDVEVYERLPGGVVDPILKVEAPGTPHEKRTDYDRRRN